MSALVTLVLLLINVAMSVTSITVAPVEQAVAAEPGVSGYVLGPDGAPVSGGTVVAQSGFMSARAAIDGAGRFRVVTARSGSSLFVVNVPGLAPYRVAVTVPDSRSLRLPVIRLVPGSYYRVRLVSATGELITAPPLRRRLFDTSGKQIAEPPGDRVSTDADGALTIGPMPRSIMAVAVDMPPYAQTRLPDVNLTEVGKAVDGGTVAIQRPGAVLHVDVLDGTGAPVPNHDVFLEDPRPRSPLTFRPVRTNQQGRATFERLAAGRYRVSTGAADWCANVQLSTSRVVPVPDSGTVELPLVVGGVAAFRITSPLGPAKGLLITAAPSVPTPPLPFRSRAPSFGCRGATDGDGRVSLKTFPPGPAHVDVHMGNSTYVRQIAVPSDGRELAINIPDGLLSVHVVDGVKNQAVTGANITWTGSGARVEASASAAGDALLEGVGTAGGTLAVSARGYEPFEEPLTEPPGVPHTVVLKPLPPAPTLRPRVITTSGAPLRNAVIELVSVDPAAVPRVAVTDAKGVVTFSDLPSGSLQLTASADGFVTSTVSVGEDPSREIVFTLSPGYRVTASVELPAAAGPQRVSVLNDDNISMDSFLDNESDRRIEPPGRLSLGPLAPGTYVIELQGAGGRRTERIRIADRDVNVTLR